MERFGITALATATLALGSMSAGAAPFTYNDFSSTAGLQLNGSAAQVSNEVRLTPAAFGQGGSMFSTSAITLGSNGSFSTYFQFRITNSGGIGDGDGVGADGIVFVIQTVANNVGGAGGGIGYLGIANSLGIEFDTYDNGGPCDPNGNHVGIDVNGSVCSLKTQTEATRFNNGQIWNAWVDYNGATNGLDVRWSQSTTRPGAAQLSDTQNLASILGQNSAFIGFTAGTGAGYGDQNVLRWEFRDSFDPINRVPEPGTLALIAIATLSAFGLNRRRGEQSGIEAMGKSSDK